MYPIQNADGHVGITKREYPIASGTAIRAGQVVQLSGGKVISAAAAQTGAILGIAAENHPGTADALNPRANGERIYVCDSPFLLFECPVPVLSAASGSATTVVLSSLAAALADDSLNNGVLVLKEKAAESGNTDPLGKQISITDYAKSGTVITKASGGTPSAGDKYELYPPIGSAVAALDSTYFSHLVLTASGATAIRVVGHDFERGRLRCMASLHSLAVDKN